MSNKILIFSTFVGACFLGSSAAWAQQSIIQQNITQSSTSISVNEQGQSIQRQETDLVIDDANTNQAYTLSINAPEGTKLTGQVTLDGKVIQELKGNQATINLSQFLKNKGTKRITVSGTYQPVESPITIQLVGPGTQVSQQTSGYGRLDQVFDINVQ